MGAGADRASAAGDMGDGDRRTSFRLRNRWEDAPTAGLPVREGAGG
ncbi:Hypothetical protein CAP_4386 [Chondromyces apiculatus DSM 436]|uniref:Uncharacterized protein n=1 Tax=Chondromyces apiculatus DSM 436 TaxID=1192034 RepID=A0A017T7N3_9BACT|nr:Hypothetical protein CAP_4386 [Chondromyces apiculatus DSM 436]